MYAVEYKTDSCDVCKTVERNLKASGIRYTSLDKKMCKAKLYKTPYTEFYSDDGVLMDHRIGLISIYDIRHILSTYDSKKAY